jgi:predicted ferric reductase
MENNKKTIGWIIAIVIGLLPALYWLIVIAKYPADFSNFSTVMGSFGKLTGLVGMTLFGLTMLLNTRLSFLENLFGGLDQVYKAHHIFGTVSFLLVLFHPLFLASRLIVSSIRYAAQFLLPINGFAQNVGELALVSMLLFLIMTFFINMKYNHWKFSHRFLGASFILASMHVMLISSDTSRNVALRIFMVLVILVGVGSFVYRTLLGKMVVRKRKYVIKDIRPLDNTLTELTFAPAGPTEQPMRFIPGQFVFISLQTKGFTEPHPFTISSSNADENIRLSIKNLGDYTSQLGRLKKNSKADIEGPYGRFSFSFYPGKKFIFIAGGIGITPFLSYMRSIRDNPKRYSYASIDFYYCVKTESEAIFMKELSEIQQNLKNVRIMLFCSDKQGYMKGDIVRTQSKSLDDKHIFICGPPAMMLGLKKQFLSMGVSKNNLHLEEFNL